MYQDPDFPPGGGRLAQFMRLVDDFESNNVEAAVDGLNVLLDQRDADCQRVGKAVRHG